MKPTILAIPALLILASTAAFAAEPFPPLDATLLDPATFAERIGSAPESLVQGDAQTAKLGPKAAVWCKLAKPHCQGA